MDSRTYLEEIIASLINEARRIGGVGGIGDNTNTAMTARKPAKAKPICKYYGKIHKSENCWQEFPEKKPSARLTTTHTAGNQNPSDNQFSSYSIAFHTQTQHQYCNTWILDSGATQHMCNDKSQFTKLEQYSTSITTANNIQMNACGKGNRQLVTRNGTSFTLVNVLYVPQLVSNLLSVCCATANPHMRFIMYKANVG